MKKFLIGFARIFITLLAVFTGFEAWENGHKVIALLCFIVFIGLVYFRIQQIKKTRNGS